ncbi:MAG: NAD(P) transhydrogenase subunit alpha [Alphaproteobacteria bacterium]|nr:NAD(P) transhydrogenase subunit alpha [Alphaproteobacteria bacterium]
MKLFVPSEGSQSDSRVAITPDVVKKLVSNDYEVYLQSGVGDAAGFSDIEYVRAEATIAEAGDISTADVVFSINPLPEQTLSSLKTSATLVSLQDTVACRNWEVFERKKLTVFALNLIPRTTRAQYMDVLSSQASLAGYKAVIEAAHLLNRAMPLMMTTAGTIPAAKVLVIGAGVAGLQAIATARRLGAVVSAFDVRASAKEQVESLEAKFIEVEAKETTDGVYAKEMGEEYKRAQEQRLRAVLPSQDIVVTTAQIPGKKAPVIVKSDMVESMKRGSVIIDLAAKTGGNCELTISGQTVERTGVRVVGFDNILNLIPFDASKLFAKNMLAFFELLTSKLSEQPDLSQIDDEIIRATLVAHGGKILV